PLTRNERPGLVGTEKNRRDPCGAEKIDKARDRRRRVLDREGYDRRFRKRIERVLRAYDGLGEDGRLRLGCIFRFSRFVTTRARNACRDFRTAHDAFARHVPSSLGPMSLRLPWGRVTCRDEALPRHVL